MLPHPRLQSLLVRIFGPCNGRFRSARGGEEAIACDSPGTWIIYPREKLLKKGSATAFITFGEWKCGFEITRHFCMTNSLKKDYKRS